MISCEGTKMNTVTKYSIYQKVGGKLNKKIMDKCLDFNRLKKSAKLMDIYKNGVFVLESEAEEFRFLDFAINDFCLGSKNAVYIYRDEIWPKNDIERRYYTTPIGSEKRLVSSILTLETPTNHIEVAGHE